MKPVSIDGYLFDLYKGGKGKVLLMVMDKHSSSPGHVDVDVAVLLRALALLLPEFARPVPEDPDLETPPNLTVEASLPPPGHISDEAPLESNPRAFLGVV